jgi:two-component system, LytTR family, sensor kinase
MMNHLTLKNRGWLAPTLVVVLVLVLMGALFTAQLTLSGYMTAGEALKFTLPLWLPWMAFAPLTAHLAFRFPLERQQLRKSVVVHLAACALVIAGNQVVTRRYMTEIGFDRPPPWMIREAEKQGVPPLIPAPDSKAESPRSYGGPAVARIAMDVLVYGILLSACQTVASSRRAQDRERRALTAESQLSQARLSALRMQLNPHFLFNSLNGIATLIHTDPVAADDMIGNLSGFLRLSLDTTGEQEIPLLRELDFLQTYLEIEQARFGERLQVLRDIAQDTLVACVPTLILQPLIENAIRHGFEKITTTGIIQIIARREGDTLSLIVQDNGSGLSDSALSGIGLTNTRARLHVLYGEDQHLVLHDLETGGCLAEIRIPYHSEPLAIHS